MEPGMIADLRQRAIAWHIRLRHGDDATWDAFAEWLAEDVAHQQAYDEIEQADLAVEPLLADVQFHEAANDPADIGQAEPESVRPWHARRWGFAGGALAAGIAAAVLVAPHLGSSRYDISTGPDERREIALDASTRIILNGSTRMTFDHKDARFAAIDSGEALFHVRHDPATPFHLQVGDARVEDIGTVFDVVRDGREVRVAVAEGAVSYAVAGAATPLGPGQALIDRAGAVQVASVATGSVGDWQAGRLIYSGQPLARVAADLSRSLGIDISVAPAIAERPFSGAIILQPGTPAADQRQRLAVALDVSLEAGTQGWTARSRSGAGR